MVNKNTTARDIEELLASDDELPPTYNETPITPAYLMQSRFEPIKFSWVENLLPKNNDINKDTMSCLSFINEKSIYDNIQQLNIGEELLIVKGVLSKIDTYCLKSIGTYASGATLLWLINFFMHKDLHESYNYLTSCLVPKYSEIYDKSQDMESTNLIHVEIVIK